MNTTSRTTIVSIAAFVERWILSLVFLCLAAREFTALWEVFIWRHPTVAPPMVEGSRHAILLLLGMFTALLLLIARRPEHPPERLKYVVVPLITTFYTTLYYAASAFPLDLQRNIFPSVLQKWMMVLGWSLVVIGPLVSLWGILYLGRSFGVFVAVRKVVLGGPYRWVRHPMYFGWVLICIGVAATNGSIAYFLLTAIHIALLAYRARLEESELAARSPEYREYMGSAGFLVPKFFGKSKTPAG